MSGLNNVSVNSIPPCINILAIIDYMITRLFHYFIIFIISLFHNISIITIITNTKHVWSGRFVLSGMYSVS